MKTHVQRNVHSSFIQNCQEWQQPRCPSNSEGRNCIGGHHRTLLHPQEGMDCRYTWWPGGSSRLWAWVEKNGQENSWTISFMWNSSKCKLIYSQREQTVDAWVEGRGGDGRDRLRKRRGERNYKETREIYRHKHAHQFHCVHAVLPKPI